MKSNLVLHVPRSGSGLPLLAGVHAKFKDVLALSGFSESGTSASLDVSVIFANGQLMNYTVQLSWIFTNHLT